jgi:glycosyltransferase involved in cell wall biosynthesis
MKLLLVNTYDVGGAAKACIRLHIGLLRAGIESKLLLKESSSGFLPEAYTYEVSSVVQQKGLKTRIKRKVKRLLREFNVFEEPKVVTQDSFVKNRDSRLEMFSYPDSELDITTNDKYLEADIIHLHWVAEFIRYSDFFIKTQKPIIWTLHDMNPFTGGEHYSESLLGMDENGNFLPRQLQPEEAKMFELNLLLKKQALGQMPNLHIVTLCNWMSEEVSKSDIFKQFPVTIIPNGIDSKIFKYNDQAFARKVFNLPQEKTVLLFVADYIENFRKGYAVLLKALEGVANPNIVLCSIGNKFGELIENENLIELGEIKDERLMSLAYTSADAFIIPSLMDNLPNTVIESLMCGTPVIGFPVGGIKDLIQHQQNGIIANDISATGLCNAIKQFIVNKDHYDRETISSNATEKYGISVMVDKYKALYKSILNE